MKGHSTAKATGNELADIAKLSQQIDAQAQEVYRLAQVVKLAAFAAEARRTLVAIGNACVLDPQLADELAQYVDAVNNWGTFDDVSGEVLRALGSSLERIAEKADGMAMQMNGSGSVTSSMC
ncbi:hypothetical protein GTZ97_02385 [Aquabacterium fontiphilum]|uniref:hypothetical protein n=1 Tax=Aquabacterium fontiphilum TaxID=450365 RepID=UPI001377710D|nr:hypothetical protein [Aquabacterium fontiphilum]NBD19522.1 hypothetical protein [Aquabacterium fontiphilum]